MMNSLEIEHGLVAMGFNVHPARRLITCTHPEVDEPLYLKTPGNDSKTPYVARNPLYLGRLLRLLYQFGDGPQAESFDEQVKDDLEAAHAELAAATETQREQLILARRGQGEFRRGVDKLWNNCCALTGVEDRAYLRESHLKPWRKSNNVERLDACNGLLLETLLDIALDQGHIAFENDGTLIVCPRAEWLFMVEQRSRPLRLAPLEPRQVPFLEWHRRHVFGAGS